MLDKNSPIGIIDSGIGGYSVARRLQGQLPGEHFIYFGDGANIPYGNHPLPEILHMTRRLLRFMAGRQVKVLVVACNTISCVLPQLRGEMDCPVLNVVEAGAQAVAKEGLKQVGVISSCFTARSGCYPDQIHKLCPGVQVVSRGCLDLADRIERHIADPEGREAIDREIQNSIGGLEHLGHFLWACTHYPLVEENFRRLYPKLQWIDPAGELAERTRSCLEDNDLLRCGSDPGELEIYTIGSAQEYAQKAELVGLRQITRVEHLAV